MNYIELINRFWNCSKERAFNPSDCMLYFYLLDTCNALHWKQPFGQSDRYLSMALGISVPTVREAKNRLKQRGLIDFKAPEKGSKGIDGQTKYSFTTVQIDYTVPLTVESEIKPTVQINYTDTCTDALTVPLTDTCTDALTNNKLNKTKQNNKKSDFDLSFVDIVFLPIVKDFIEYRKQIKKPYKTQQGIKTFYNELTKLSRNNFQKAKELVEYAKGKEWQTVYEIKNYETNKRNFERKPHSSERL